MEINDFYDLFLYSSFFIMVLLIVLPVGTLVTYKALALLIRDKKIKLEEDSIVAGISKNAFELVFIGLFSLGSSIWYLFFDGGGNLFRYPIEVLRFFSGG